MPADCFFDTTILIYAIAQDDPRAAVAEALLAEGGVISVQVLNEFAAVARRKFGMEWSHLNAVLGAIRRLCEPPVPVTLELHESAMALCMRYRFSVYDSLIVAAAVAAGCTTLYTEDLQHGQKIGGLRVVNPFGTGSRRS